MSTKTAAIAVTTILTTKPMKPKFRYLSAWFCPYAHRATIALEYHQAHVDYVWVEALGWYQKTTKETKNDTDTNTNVDNNAPTTATAAATLNTPTPVNNNNNSSSNDNKDDDNTEWYYHWKAEELKRVNPSALVPTLVPIIRTPKAASSTTTTAEKTIAVEEKDEEMVEIVDESKAVYESLVTIDYIDMVANNYRTSIASSDAEATNSTIAMIHNRDTDGSTTSNITNHFSSLVPYHDPYEYAKCRIWVDKVNRECCSPYYDILVRQDPTERQMYFQKLLSGIRSFIQELTKTSGPTFLSDGRVCNVDIALFPWAYRYYVLQHYCGTDFVIPPSNVDPTYEPYHIWYEYMIQLDYIQRTVPDQDRYLDHIQKYANGTARSKVANAVRRGVAAHELDDEQDEYK